MDSAEEEVLQPRRRQLVFSGTGVEGSSESDCGGAGGGTRGGAARDGGGAGIFKPSPLEIIEFGRGGMS